MMLQLPIYCIMREILRRMKQEDTDHIGMQQNLDENVVEKKGKKEKNLLFAGGVIAFDLSDDHCLYHSVFPKECDIVHAPKSNLQMVKRKQ